MTGPFLLSFDFTGIASNQIMNIYIVNTFGKNDVSPYVSYSIIPASFASSTIVSLEIFFP